MSRPRWFKPITALIAIATLAGVNWVRDTPSSKERFNVSELTGTAHSVQWDDTTTVTLRDVLVAQQVDHLVVRYSTPDIITCFLMEIERRGGSRRVVLVPTGDIDGELRMPVNDVNVNAGGAWTRTSAWTCFETTVEEQPRLKLLLTDHATLITSRRRLVVSAGLTPEQWKARMQPGAVLAGEEPAVEYIR